MNVYDFDGTVYDGDSSKDFYLFCLKHDKKAIRALPVQISGFMKYFLRKIDKTEMKEDFFSFLNYVPNVESVVSAFWKEHEPRINQWYLKQKKQDDVIISASPEFLLKPVCEKLGVRSVIASEVDCYTGKFTSPNCRGKEKVIRFRKIYPDIEIDDFYSDSESDGPMASIAKHAYLIKHNRITEWKK